MGKTLKKEVEYENRVNSRKRVASRVLFLVGLVASFVVPLVLLQGEMEIRQEQHGYHDQLLVAVQEGEVDRAAKLGVQVDQLSARAEQLNAISFGIVVLGPAFFYTSLLTVAAAAVAGGSVSPRWQHGFRLIGLAMGTAVYAALGLYVSGGFVAGVLGFAGILYCFLADLFTPSVNSGALNPHEEAEDPKLIAQEETGSFPAGVNFDPARGVTGIPTTPGFFTLTVHNDEAAIMRVTYSVDDDLERSNPALTAESSKSVTATPGKERIGPPSDAQKALVPALLLLFGVVAVALDLLEASRRREANERPG